MVVSAKPKASTAKALPKRPRGPKTNYKVIEPELALVLAAPFGKSFRDGTDAEILEWFNKQDARYRGNMAFYAATGGFELVDYLRRCSAPACSCGFDGSPLSIHYFNVGCKPVWQMMRAKLLKPHEFNLADNDDLPF